MFKRKSTDEGVALLPAHILVWVYAALLGIPIYFVIVSAFKDNIAIFDTPLALPTSLSFDNFIEAWNTVKLGRGLLNSLIVTTMSELVTLAFALPAAYGIARSKGKPGAIIERVFALGFLIPAFAALVPTLLLSIKLNMYQTLPFFSLFLSATTLPLSIILLAQFMRAIPSELEESAMLDGATRWQTLRFIYLPLSRPGIALVVILNFLTYWNEYLFSLVLLGYQTSTRTVQVALPILVTNSTQYGVLLAGTLLSLIPVYIVYIFFHRKIEGALLAGSIKV
jgi:multiple sugar transport system permease protein